MSTSARFDISEVSDTSKTIDISDIKNGIYYLKASGNTENYSKKIEFSHLPNSHINNLIISFNSDWLFPTKENLEIVKILNYLQKKVSFIEITTDKGHDSFLLDEPDLDEIIKGFLETNFNKINE